MTLSSSSTCTTSSTPSPELALSSTASTELAQSCLRHRSVQRYSRRIEKINYNILVDFELETFNHSEMYSQVSVNVSWHMHTLNWRYTLEFTEGIEMLSHTLSRQKPLLEPIRHQQLELLIPEWLKLQTMSRWRLRNHLNGIGP